MKQNYILGLDLGTGSVGWSLVAIDNSNEPYRIIDLGARIFDSEVADLEKRRIARSTRRLIRRRAARIKKTKSLFIKNNYLSHEQISLKEKDNKIINDITLEKIGYANILDLRLKGKKEKLSYEELYVLLINYVKHRGFKSNRKVEEENVDKKSDEGKLLTAIHGTEAALQEIKEKNPEATFSDYLKQQFDIKGKMHNDKTEYSYGITRKMVEEEVDAILDKQIEEKLINEDFKADYKEALFKQLHYSTGPEEGPYSNPLAKSIGNCHFVPGKKRASRNSVSYLKFVLAQKLTDLRYSISNSKTLKSLNGEQIKKIVNDFAKGKTINYSVICKEIGTDCFIKNVDDLRNRKINEEKRKEEFIKLKKGKFGDLYKGLKNALKKAGFENLDDKYFDLLSECFSRYKSDFEIKDYLKGNREELKELDCPDNLIEFALSYKDTGKFKTFGSVSLDFVYKVLPHLLEGKDLYAAKQEEGFRDNIVSNDEELDTIPLINETLEKLEKTINNRGVVRTIVESRKVINAIIERYGMPYEVHMEMARDLTLSKLEKKDFEEKQKKNYNKKQNKINEIYDKHSEAFGEDISRITSLDILKYDLFKEQKGICLYTLARTGNEQEAKINESKIFDKDYVEIEHIIPYSKSFDDRNSNKILVLTKENREKGENIPGKYYKGQTGYDKYCFKVNELYDQEDNKYKQNKKNRLLSEDITEFLGDYRARTINDTRYAMNAFKDVMTYSFPNLKVRTYVGGLTDKLRALWRLNNLTTSYLSKDYTIKNEEEDTNRIKELLTEIEKTKNDNNLTPDKLKDVPRYKEVIKEIEKIYEKGRKNRENHFHHMIDATIIACATDKIRMNVEKQEILYRIENKENSFSIDMPKINEATGELVFNEETGEVTYERVTLQRNDENILSDTAAYYNSQRSKFPVPYYWFVDELKTRALEMDEDRLKEKLREFKYTEEEISKVKPTIISHYYSGKASGKLHEETYMGKRIENGNEVLVKKISLKSEKFDKKQLEKIYDKEVSQCYIYQVVKDWLGDYKNGIEAFNARQDYPLNKNGNRIKRVAITVHKEIREEFVLKEKQNNYVSKENNIETWIYKKDGDERLYFVGLDAYRLKNIENKEKDLSTTLWHGRGKNYIKLPMSDLEKEGFKLYRKIVVGQTILLETKEGKALCIAGGSSSGFFEVKSINGDGYELVANGIFNNKREGQYLVTVSNIKDVKPISIDVLGKIH